MKIHHIGYLVKKLPKAAEEFRKLGYQDIGSVTDDQIRKVDILFLEKDGYVVELVSPNSPESVVAGLIKTYKNAPYHICYVCDKIEEDVKALTERGYFQMDEPTEAPALDRKRVCFLMHPQMGMIELLES